MGKLWSWQEEELLKNQKTINGKRLEDGLTFFEWLDWKVLNNDYEGLYNVKSYSDCTKEELDKYFKNYRKDKTNITKYESLKCKNCNNCKQIQEMKNGGQGFWHGTNTYFIKCKDGCIRTCEVGQDKPTNCDLFEQK